MDDIAYQLAGVWKIVWADSDAALAFAKPILGEVVLVPNRVDASSDFCLRYCYFAFACLLYNVWKLVDLLLRDVRDVGGDGPVVSFMAVAGFVRRDTGIG